MRNNTALSTQRVRAAAIAVAATFALAACGGGGGDSTAPSPVAPPASAPAETLFVPTNAWTGATPANAQSVTPDEFRRRQGAGELVLVTADTGQAQRAAHQAHVAAERAFLESQADVSDTVKALLTQAAAATDLEADAAVTLPDGRVVALNSLGTAIENAAAGYRRARDPALALAAYELSYAPLDDALKAQMPAPATLAGATLEQVRQAAQQMEAALATLPDIDNTRLDPSVPPTPAVTQGSREHALAFNPGMGRDNNGRCTPSGYALRYQFPLRNFVSPVKDQGERGLCWAFAAIGAVESRDQVQLGTTPDLSEQFLANRVKLLWAPNDWIDGGSAAFALNTAEDRFQRLPFEAAWTYNPAPGRPDNAFDSGVVGTPASYYGACDGYSGSCWPVSHQSDIVCTMQQGDTFCSYEVHNFPDTASTGLRGSRVLPVWASGESWKLNVYRAHLAAGRSLIAVFPIYDAFSTVPPTGILSNYKRQKMDKKTGKLVDGSSGDHLAQIVGFISNEQLSLPGGPPSEVGGGGYFILRNSWGCTVADSGYYYVPADYVRDNFYSLEVLDMLPNRSARWNADQIAPGGTAGLSVNLRPNAAAGLRIRTDLASEIVVNHPVANYARLTVTSDRDGLLFDGQWLVNPPIGGSLFANSLPVTFQTEGSRQVTVVARYGSQQVTTTQAVVALNSAPIIRFEDSGKPPQNENVVVNTLVTDFNEADPASICAAMTWQVTAPDVIVSGSGCSRVIRFGATGNRQVSVSTRDNEGLTASATGNFDVVPPLVNPYPRISTFGVFSRDVLNIGNLGFGCISNAVANSALIDLRQLGCKLTVLGPDLSRYFGQIAVENPSGEVLSYDWTYNDYYPNGTVTPRTGTLRTTTPTMELNKFLYLGLDNAKASAFRCTVDVRVNAPEASRSKTLRVWSGQCINVEVGPS
ncbi:MAG: C1 family peptidase [Rhizobacter sp.]